MHGDSLPIPGVEKISRLIDALRNYALKEAGSFPGESWAASYNAPNLGLWDAFLWFELAQDREVVEFLTSGTYRARVLLSSLQSLMQWYGQSERDDMLRRMSIIN
ncbi:MAG: hypothetical protein ACHQ0Y_02350 [Thermodesulfovibrionales bacterium]